LRKTVVDNGFLSEFRFIARSSFGGGVVGGGMWRRRTRRAQSRRVEEEGCYFAGVEGHEGADDRQSGATRRWDAAVGGSQ